MAYKATWIFDDEVRVTEGYIPAPCKHERWADMHFGKKQCMDCGKVEPY